MHKHTPHTLKDLGQKTFGHVTCKVCGMVYTFGQAEDEMEHVKFHKKFISGVKFAVSCILLLNLQSHSVLGT